MIYYVSVVCLSVVIRCSDILCECSVSECSYGMW